MIFVAGISIALFISALLLVKKNKSASDQILLVWMLLNAAHLALFYASYTKEIFKLPYLLGIEFPFSLLHGVLLFFYVSSVTNQTPKKKYLHLVPTVLVYCYLIPFFSLPAKEKIAIFKNNGAGYETFQTALLILVFLSGIIYVVLSSRLLKKHKNKIKNEFSNLEEVDLNWLQFLTIGLGLIWGLVILTQNNSLIFSGVSIFVILIGFFGVQQPSIFNNPKPTIKQQTTQKKYVNSGLSEDAIQTLFNDLEEKMNKEEVYKDSNLSLSQLAKTLNTHPNYLSQVINHKTGANFYDYVNTFRIEEFKRLIKIPENQKYTLITLAYDCGFNSKSSFNRYFKKATNQTPSEYLKSLN